MNYQNKLVSIAMATYNGEKYLRKQLESIYNQTYKNIEFIVCDDRSSDKTVKILQEYQNKYGLKFFINEQNLGFVKNFEKAASLCTGEYIAFADQDDVWLPDKIEILLSEIGNNSLICSDAKLIDENNNQVAESLVKNLNFDTRVFLEPPELIFKKLFYTPYALGCTILFDKNLLKEALPIPEGFSYHDYWFLIVACKHSGVKFIDRPLVLYRRHSDNITGKLFSNTNFYSKIGSAVSALLKEKKQFRKKRFESKLKDINILIDKTNLLTKNEKELFKESCCYFYSIITSKLSFEALKFIIRNKTVLYNKKSYIYCLLKYILLTLF